MLESFVVGNGKSFCAEWKEVSDDRSMLLVPSTLGDTNFCEYDGEELAPERKS